MKLFLFIFSTFMFITFFCSCDSYNLIGADNVEVIKDVEFTVTEMITNSNNLTAKGVIKNVGNSKITLSWYIECDFYSDDSSSFKFGGVNYRFNYSLDKGESTAWQLIFSSSKYDESQYPDFAVKNLRAYYEVSD